MIVIILVIVIVMLLLFSITILITVTMTIYSPHLHHDQGKIILRPRERVDEW